MASRRGEWKMVSYTPRGRDRAVVCIWLAWCCACGAPSTATDAYEEASNESTTFIPAATEDRGAIGAKQGAQRVPKKGGDRESEANEHDRESDDARDKDDRDRPQRLVHEAVQDYDAVSLWHTARALCSATQGTWAPALATCHCPAKHLFAPPMGCVPAPPLQPRAGGCETGWATSHMPTRCLKELTTPGLALHFNWNAGKRARDTFEAHASHDWTRWFGGTLALPTAPGTLHLTNSKRFLTPWLAWLTFDATEPLPQVAPWSPRAAMHEGDNINTAPACAAALRGAEIEDGAIAPLCEGIATTQAAVRNPQGANAAVLRAVLVSTNAQAHVALVQAHYAWQGITSNYKVPWANDIAVNRHIISDDARGHRMIAFISPTGTVHAWAVYPNLKSPGVVFDDAGKALR